MDPLETILVVVALVSFAIGCLGFLVFILKVGWGVRGYVQAQQDHAKSLDKAIGILGDFVVAQKDMMKQVMESLGEHRAWLQKHDEEHKGLDRSMRGLYRELEELQEGAANAEQ